MPASPAGDPILKRFRAAPDTLYGDRIERVVATFRSFRHFAAVTNAEPVFLALRSRHWLLRKKTVMS
jgi:hypothetical protein